MEEKRFKVITLRSKKWIKAYIERDLSPGGGLNYQSIEEDAAKIKPEIVLSGPAKDFLFSGSNTTDSIPEPDDSGEVDLLVE